MAFRSTCTGVTHSQTNMEARELDRTRFTQEIPIKALCLPAAQTQTLLQSLSSFLFNRKGFPKVAHLPGDSTQNLLLLRQDLTEIPSAISSLNLPIVNYTVKMTYENLSYGSVYLEEVMKMLLPPDVTIPTGFETVGHLAHFNLSEPQLPYKNLIGQVIIDVLSM